MKTPSADLAARLVARAPELLGPQGVPRFEEVAALVGVSRATLYYYFSGQDDLLAFLLAAHVDEGAAALAAADPDGDTGARRLRAVLAAIATYLGGRPAMCAALLSAASSGGSLREVLARTDARIVAPLRAIIAAGNDDGSLAAPDVADAADALLGAILMAVLGRSARGADPATADFRHALVHQLVRGVTA